MSRSKLMPKDVFGQSGSTNVAKGFALVVNVLIVAYRHLKPGLHEEAISNLLEILEEIVELPPCICILSMESIHDMIKSTMPVFIDSVRNEAPYLIHRLELIDWRTIFGIPTLDVQINANVPSGNNSATGPK